MASPGRCCLWSCPEQVSPYCSENHQNDAVTGEASAFGVAIAGARSDDEIRRISVKCLRARALVRATGVPELPVASLTTTPWLLANTFFNRDLHPDQTVKNWVFFSLADPPGMWRIWKYYDERNVAEDIRRRRFNLEAPARSTDGGRFTLKKFRLEGFAAVAFVAFYWLTFEASAAGQKGVYTPLVKPIQAPKGFGDHRKRGLETSSGNLGKKRRGEEKAPELISASSRDYNVDMMPKFMMGNGKLVRVLIHTDVTKYLSFKAVDGSYVFVKGKFQKLPVTPMEALKSPLMGIFENRRAGKFFSYVQDYDEKDPKTHNGMDLTKLTTKELIAKFGLDDNTIDFIGHAVALHTNDQHLNQPALDTVMRTKAFARLSAVYGGTYMLNKPECKVEFDEEGKVIGVTCEGETAKCKKIVCDPSYLPVKVRKIGRVARAIAIMSLPIPNTNDSHSVQVILPQKQLARKSDMYVFCCSYSHNVAPKGKFIAFVSTDAETDNPQTELKAGIDLLGAVNEIFFDMYDRYEPVNEPALDNCFISTSYDATTHFETTVADVLNMYTLITGKERHDNMKNCMLDMMLPKSFVLVLLCNSL